MTMIMQSMGGIMLPGPYSLNGSNRMLRPNPRVRHRALENGLHKRRRADQPITARVELQ